MIQLIGFAVMTGFLLLLITPALLGSLGTGPAGRVGNIYAAIAMQTLNRASISVSPNADFTLRRRGYDPDYSADWVDVDGQKKRITKISNSVHRWGSRPFTFVDEYLGVSFDLRDVLVASVEHEHKLDGDMTAVEYQYEEGENGDPVLVGANSYVRALLNVGHEQRALSMDLSQSVNAITDGAEDASMWDRVYEGVKRMFLPYQQSTGFMKLLLPVIGLVGSLFAGFYLFGPGVLPGATGGGRALPVGSTLLLLLTPTDVRERARDNWKAIVASVALLLVVIMAALLGILSMLLVFAVVVVLTVVLLPLGSATVISALPAKLAEPIAEAWMTLGLKAFEDPIIRQTKDAKFRVDEADELGLDESGDRYRMCKAWVGFTCDVDPDAFGSAAVKGSQIYRYRSSSELATDGGEMLPDGFEPTDAITNADHMGFIPTHDELQSSPEKKKATWVRSDRWLRRFANASTGKIAERAQQEATKEFADGAAQFSDRAIIVMTMVATVFGLGSSVLLWGL